MNSIQESPNWRDTFLCECGGESCSRSFCPYRLARAGQAGRELRRLAKASEPRKPIPKMSPAQRAAKALWDAVTAQRIVMTGGVCEASIENVCDGPGAELHGHHYEPRGRCGRIDTLENCRAVCGSCEAWIHAHPALAASMGLLASNKYPQAAGQLEVP